MRWNSKRFAHSSDIYRCRMCAVCGKFQWGPLPSNLITRFWWITDDADAELFLARKISQEDIVLLEAETQAKRTELLEVLLR